MAVTALSLPLAAFPSSPGFAQGFKFSPTRRAGNSRPTSRVTRPAVVGQSKSPSRVRPGVSLGGFKPIARPKPPRTIGGQGKYPRPGVTIPSFPKPGATFPKPGVTIPSFPGKPGVTFPKPGATVPFFPGKPGLTPLFPGKPGAGNGLKPGVIGKLDGLAKFENLVGKVPNQKFTPIGPSNLKGLGLIHKAKDLQLKSIQGVKAKSFAIQKLSLHPGCHWWVDFCIGWHWHHHHCHWWDYCYTPGYWHCWTPCHYHVIHCPPAVGYVSTSWYFGVECMLIPDMACYGIQKVQPNSPAALAGLQPGDMIVSINGQSIADESVLQRQIQSSAGLLQLGVVRNGATDPVRVDVALRQLRALSY